MDAIICYKYKKLDHVKYDCSNVKKKKGSEFKYKKNRLKASTWDDKNGMATSSSDNDDLKLEKLVNLSSMANININK